MIHQLRSFLVILLWAPPCALAILLLGAVGGPSAGYPLYRFWARTSWWLAGIRLRVERAPNDARARIFVCNHPSPMDPLWLMAVIHGRMAAVAKQEISRMPVIGGILRASGWIFLDRSDRQAAIRSLERALKRLQQGDSVLLFPEGKRSEIGRAHV